MTLVVFPDNPEAYYPVSFSQALEYACSFVLGALFDIRDYGRRHFGDGLLKFGLIPIPAVDACQELLESGRVIAGAHEAPMISMQSASLSYRSSSGLIMLESPTILPTIPVFPQS
jgi:hypothetical protein